MATKNLFDLTEKTVLADTDKIAAGEGTTNAFNITWAAFKTFLKTLFVDKSTTQDIGGIKNFTSGIKEGGILLADIYALKGGSSAQDFLGKEVTASSSLKTNEDGKQTIIRGDRIYAYETGVGYTNLGLNNNKSVLVYDTGILVAVRFYENGIFLDDKYAFKAGSITQDFSANTMTANQYLPFTGCHLAEFHDQDFKDYELVKIKAIGFSSDKQPIWEASYAEKGEKGIFGVIYGISTTPIMEEYEDIEIQKIPIMETRTIYEVQEIDNTFKKVAIEKEFPVMEKKSIEGTDEFVEIEKTEEKEITVKKTRQIGETKHWMIASVGDMPMFVCGENGNIEYGDKLTPSSIDGVAMKANTNSPVCGIAGQDIIFKADEIVKIGVTKE